MRDKLSPEKPVWGLGVQASRLADTDQRLRDEGLGIGCEDLGVPALDMGS